ncbi:pyridoxamine 5'-phosphate oxidase family protein [Acidocella sp.]|uniref:pyridoxamine 5'-phosphate oxidase family protein n=1 Tax=Acidocella sp. TaxID=50710 RepID=UPI002636A30D|nr:pyridoxamine 5'-phosphate oxidase family protein [Acidocella sp.]MDD2794865.1 pyridoxamine 5'-phosphate oxidase family protein [Acidocella sp.]
MAANQERNFYAEAASLLATARAGTLATTTPAGLPHAALATPAPAADGAPLLLLSDLAAHTRNLRANPACALLITGAPVDENPQTAPRLLLSGTARISTAPTARERFLRIHPYAAQYAGFTDFNLWRLEVNDAHYVGGFAAASRLQLAALQHEINLIFEKYSG